VELQPSPFESLLFIPLDPKGGGELTSRLSAGETPTAFGANNSGIGAGGSTLHWGAFVPRADARDLKMGTEFGKGVDWPLEYEDLRPYYEELEEFLGVSGPPHYPWDPSRHYPLPPVPLNAPAQLMRTGCAAIGLRTSEAPVAAVSRSYVREGYEPRHACVNRGYCHQGCRNGAKASMDVTYLPAAVRSSAEIRCECFVHHFEVDANRGITAVIYEHDGMNFRQRCRAVFLCAGAVETPRLLLHCDQPGRNGLGNSSGQVGRNFMAHVATQVWGTFDQETRPNKGFPASLITEDLIRPNGVTFAGGLHRAEPGHCTGHLGHAGCARPGVTRQDAGGLSRSVQLRRRHWNQRRLFARSRQLSRTGHGVRSARNEEAAHTFQLR